VYLPAEKTETSKMIQEQMKNSYEKSKKICEKS